MIFQKNALHAIELVFVNTWENADSLTYPVFSSLPLSDLWEMTVLEIGDKLITSRGSFTFKGIEKLPLELIMNNSRKENIALVKLVIHRSSWNQTPPSRCVKMYVNWYWGQQCIILLSRKGNGWYLSNTRHAPVSSPLKSRFLH